MMSKSQLSSLTDLSFASVSKLCASLAEKHLVLIEENVHSTGGRKAAMVSINPEYSYSLVLDLHHTKIIYVGLVNLKNEVVDKTSFPLREQDGLYDLLENIKTACQHLLAARKVDVYGVCAGISAVQNDGVVLQSNIPFLEGINLERCLREVFVGKLVVVENDANLAVLSQLMQFDNTKKNLLFIFLSQGVGLGLVINGKLYKGTNGFAGELGHVKVTGVEKRCKCGETGCLRLVATLESIAEDLGEVSLLHASIDAEPYARSLFERYMAKDKRVVNRINLCGMKLGEACADLYDILNPEEIIIGGSMGELFQCLIPIIRKQCRDLSKLARLTDVQVRSVGIPLHDLILQGGGERIFHVGEQEYIRTFVSEETHRGQS